MKPFKMILLCFLNFCCCIYVSLGPNNKYFSLTEEISTHGTSAKGKKQKQEQQQKQQQNPIKQINKTSSLSALPNQFFQNTLFIHEIINKQIKSNLSKI